MSGAELIHKPPILGLKIVSSPTQIEARPVKTVEGLMFTLTGVDASDEQLEPESTKVKVALPAANAVMTPWLVTEITDGFELTQVPPAEGDMVR